MMNINNSSIARKDNVTDISQSNNNNISNTMMNENGFYVSSAPIKDRIRYLIKIDDISIYLASLLIICICPLC